MIRTMCSVCGLIGRWHADLTWIDRFPIYFVPGGQIRYERVPRRRRAQACSVACVEKWSAAVAGDHKVSAAVVREPGQPVPKPRGPATEVWSNQEFRLARQLVESGQVKTDGLDALRAARKQLGQQVQRRAA